MASQVSIRQLPARAIELCVAVFLLCISFFMTVPLLAVYLATSKSIATADIGIVMAALVASSQGLQLFVGVAATRTSRSLLLGLAAAIATASYLGLATAQHVPVLALSGLGLGTGNAITGLLLKSMMAESAPAQAAAVFSLRSIAVNAGATIGPAVGAAVFNHFSYALAAAGFVYLVCWLRFGLAGKSDRRPSGEISSVRSMWRLLSDRLLLYLTTASVGFWYLYTQFTLTVPLFAVDRMGMRGSVGILFVVGAVVVIVCQYPLIKLLRARATSWMILTIGMAVAAVAFSVLTVSTSVMMLIGFVVLFALAEVTVVPTLDVVATELSSRDTVSVPLGVVAMGWALGGLLGNVIGARLYAAFAEQGRVEAFWLTNVLVALLTAAAFLFVALRGRFRYRRAEKV